MKRVPMNIVNASYHMGEIEALVKNKMEVSDRELINYLRDCEIAEDIADKEVLAEIEKRDNRKLKKIYEAYTGKYWAKTKDKNY